MNIYTIITEMIIDYVDNVDNDDDVVVAEIVSLS